MRHLLPALLLLLALATLARADDDYPIKAYPCPRLEPAPAIDGSLADACWKKAPVVSGFTWYNRPKLAPVQTSFRVGYDDRCLYFGVHSDEPQAKRLAPSFAGRDSSGCFRGETIEIFIDPRHDHENYHQFAVNLAGSFYDSRRTDPSWNSESRLKTKIIPDGWVLEFAIPWRDLGIERAKAGMVVGFNVCRDRYAGGAREWTNWSQTKANFHDPDRFAHLVLSPTEQMIGRLGGEFRKGDRRGPIVLFGHQGYASRAYLAMARTALRRLDALVAQLAAEGKKERSEAARAEVAERLGAARREVEPFRTRIGSARSLDAAEWTRMGIQMAGLERRLGHLLWEARLAALLKDI